MKQYLQWTCTLSSCLIMVGCFETPSVSPFPDLSDSGVNTGPRPRTDIGAEASSDAQASLDTYTTSVSDAAGRADIADGMLQPLDAAPTDTLRPRCSSDQVCLPAPPSSQPFFYAKTHDNGGLEIPADWCPAHSRPFANNFFTEPVNEPSCTECSCIPTEDDCGIAPLYCNIDTQPTDYTGAENLGAALGNPGCYSFNTPVGDGKHIACYTEAGTYSGRCDANGGELIADRIAENRWTMCETTASQPCHEGATVGHCYDTGQDICFRLDQGECPDWSEEHVIFQSYRDTRQCSACECESNVSCSIPDYRLLFTDECRPDFGPSPRFDSECQSYDLSRSAAARWSFIPERSQLIGDCTPSRSQGQGAVEPIEPWRVCCYKP